MRFFRLLGRVTSVVVGLALLGQPTAIAAPPVAVPDLQPLVTVAPIHVAGVDAPPGCTFTFYSNSQAITSAAIEDFTTITNTITMSGIHQPIWSVTAQTLISHTFPNDLEVILVAPDGRRNTLTTRNGGDHDNVFANTTWTDAANIGPTEAVYANGVSQPSLIPEGAMGAFRGHEANGDWKLEISDVISGDSGTLNGWALYLVTLNERFHSEPHGDANGTNKVINDGSTVTSTIYITGTGTYLLDLQATTTIPHTASGDLIVMLTAPNGYTTTLTKNNGGFNNNLFDFTTWLDSAARPVTDAQYVDNVELEQVQPEGAMSHFVGIDPRGTWTLTIRDTEPGDTGLLDYWGISFHTGYCTPVYLPQAHK